LAKRSLWKSIKKWRIEWIDHILRHGGLLGLILEGIVGGKTTEDMSQIVEN